MVQTDTAVKVGAGVAAAGALGLIAWGVGRGVKESLDNLEDAAKDVTGGVQDLTSGAREVTKGTNTVLDVVGGFTQGSNSGSVQNEARAESVAGQTALYMVKDSSRGNWHTTRRSGVIIYHTARFKVINAPPGTYVTMTPNSAALRAVIGDKVEKNVDSEGRVKFSWSAGYGATLDNVTIIARAPGYNPSNAVVVR